MLSKKGIPVSPGIAFGRALVLDTEEFQIPRRRISPEECVAEKLHVEQAFQRTLTEYEQLRESVASRLGDDTAAIFDFHIGVLSRDRIRQQILETIEQKLYTAPLAVSTVFRDYQHRFQQMQDAYLSERGQDVHDMERRLLRQLIGQERQSIEHMEEPVIVIAHDLTPSQTAELEHSNKVIAIATDLGGRTSHTSIVARSWGIPAVVGLGDITSGASNGDMVVVDGTHGVVISSPDPETIEHYQIRREQLIRLVRDLQTLRELPATTLDGVRVTLLGNIEFPHEVESSLDKGAEGVGLYRTEFLYLTGKSEPSEDEQFEAYKQVVERMAPRPVVIRTLDLGADKITQERTAEPERNPFLGCRSIRYCLQNLGLFKRQLRAILRASMYGDVHIMFPLITTLLELRQAKMVLSEAREDLAELGIPYRKDIPIGIMVETPAAADAAVQFAREADFFSIGTNDLIQYMMAVDRANERVAWLYSAAHPMVLRKVRNVIRTADRAKIPVSLCGEMAGDPLYTILLLGLGLRRFSMAAGDIPEVKKIVRSVTMQHCRRVARHTLRLENERNVLNYLRDETRKVLPEIV
jgi:phosphotransferase system enzyme I (PtsI)